MVTFAAYAAQATARLREAGVEDAAFEVRCLLEDIAGIPHGMLPPEAPLGANELNRLETALAERLDGRPLQYILGEWDFLSLRLQVGEGVLIPRPDTELLCETAAQMLQNISHPRVLDLCAGSGCVGLGIASLLPDVSVTAVEKSTDAFAYLTANVARYPQYRVQTVQADIVVDYNLETDEYDAIVSNPPYIPAEDLADLMREVQREPQMALDGGADGLDFYRVITDMWLPKLKTGGFLAVEIGFDQGEKVDRLFGSAGLKNRRVLKDLGGNDRVVVGTK